MRVHGESSAVLAWLLGEEEAARVRPVFPGAEIVVASDLTLIECDRVLIRAVTRRELAEADAAHRRAHLAAAAAAHWHVLRLGAEIVERARQPFPGEPIRTLDALHLACALTARTAVAGLELLSLDARVRSAGAHLGLPLQPA